MSETTPHADNFSFGEPQNTTPPAAGEQAPEAQQTTQAWGKYDPKVGEASSPQQVSGVETIIVPQAIGLSVSEALAEIQDAGFVPVAEALHVHPTDETAEQSPTAFGHVKDSSSPQFDHSDPTAPILGTVIDQTPQAGTTSVRGKIINLGYIDGKWQPGDKKGRSKLPIIAAIFVALAAIGLVTATFLMSASQNATVPSLVGKDIAQAQNELASAGFSSVNVTQSPSEKPTGQVVAQVPGANVSVETKTTISLTVSSGRESAKVPSVVGLSVESAKTTLQDAGFVADAITSQDSSKTAGTVLSQAPAANSESFVGTKISLITSNGKVEVPSVLGQPVEIATKSLMEAGFTVSSKNVTSTAASGTVIAQTPDPGNFLAAKSAVTISVAIPAKPTASPTPTPTPTTTKKS